MQEKNYQKLLKEVRSICEMFTDKWLSVLKMKILNRWKN